MCPWPEKTMHAWLICLLFTAVHGISRISQPSLKAVNFAQPIEGWKLNGSVISEKEVDSESSCRLECVEDERCKSFNFGSKANKAGRYICQLSDSDRFVGRVNFTEASDFRYRGVQVIMNKLTWLSHDGIRTSVFGPRIRFLRWNEKALVSVTLIRNHIQIQYIKSIGKFNQMHF